MTVKQIAEYLQMSDDKIYDMAQKRELPGSKVRNQWRFEQEEIDLWVKAQRPKGTNSLKKSFERKINEITPKK
jgi:excisionase family DNA binding protein